jgi:hypothetical protein
MDVMKDKDSLIQIKNKNMKKLHEELDMLIVIIVLFSAVSLFFFLHLQSQLDLDPNHMRALLDAELTSATGVAECTLAAQELQKCMAAEIHPCRCSLIPSLFLSCVNLPFHSTYKNGGC